MVEKTINMAFGEGYETALKNAGVFKPKAGTYKIVMLGEPKDAVFIENEGQQSEKRTPQFEANIEIEGQHYVWYIPVGKTPASLSIQLMALHKHSMLVGKPFQLIVKNDGKKNDYTVVEAQEFINSDKSKIKK